MTQRSGIDIRIMGGKEELFHAFNVTAASLQKPTYSVAEIFQAFREQIAGLGFWGGLCLLDDTGKRMVFRTVAQPSQTKTLARFENFTGLKAEGFKFHWAKVDVYRQVVETRQSVFIPDNTTVIAQMLPEAAQPYAKHIMKAFSDSHGIFAPLISGGQIKGVLNVVGASLTRSDVPPISAFANFIAIALHNIQLFAEAKQRTLELATILEASRAISSTLDLEKVLVVIAEQMVKAIEVDGCALSQWDQETDTVVNWIEWRQDDLKFTDKRDTIYSLSDYPATRALLESRQPVVIHVSDPDAEQSEKTLMQETGVLSLLMLPLAVGKRVIGLVKLDESKNEREFTPDEIRLCQAMADQAAIAINNARLFEETRRRTKRLAALHAVDIAVTASLDLRLTLQVLLDQVTSKLGIHATDVLLLKPQTQVLEFGATRGFHTGLLRKTQLRLGEGIAGRAALDRRIIGFSDLANAPDELKNDPFLESEGFSAYYAVPLIAKGQVKGVLELFNRSPLNPGPDWVEFLETLAGQAAIAIDNASLYDELQRSNSELILAYDSTLEGWAKALELRDKETEGHTQRVSELTSHLARAMEMSEADLVHIRRGALLHDIGKMAVPDSILNKPAPLNEEEWEIMRQHPDHAYRMLSPISFLRLALDIPYCHHEKWDGSGYPRGLQGNHIPMAALIFAVVDVWDALLSDRPYRQAWPEEKVRLYIQEQTGLHFDPKVVDVFLETVDHDLWLDLSPR